MLNRRSGAHQSGASSVEYLLGTTVIVALLFAPLSGSEQSVIEVLLDALRAQHTITRQLLAHP